jgi:DNA-binding YbaB/EbfC family protein
MNITDLMKNVQGLKNQFEKMQEELQGVTATGTSGGNIVCITLNGRFEMVSIELDPLALDPRDITMLQDLIMTAHSAAQTKIQEMLKAKIVPAISNIPGFPMK